MSKIFFDELAGGCKILHKITLQHIQLTPYSGMTVKYAAQVLSKTVSVALRKFGGESTTETATFCTLMGCFFDCFNTRHQDEGSRKRKTFLAPYKDQNDERFDWLENVFLKYFEVWEDSVRRQFL